MKRSDYYIGLIVAVLLILAHILLPVHWYTHIRWVDNEYPVRINKFTNESWMLHPGDGWVKIENKD